MEPLQRVFAMMGEPDARYADPDAWNRLEEELGLALPEDYKTLVDGYAPIQVNGHLHLEHPAAPGLGLSSFMAQTVEAFTSITWDEDVLCPGFESTGPLFGGEKGMVPLCSTDRGEYVFLAPKVDGEPGRLLTCDGDEQDFYEYRMSFGEWLSRYLTGDDMVGPHSAAFYPGPLLMERWPAGQQSVEWYGPERGM
ncbi:SMI1/KNR4 family protein [Streptomyces sp. NBC_00690]|uniref:SMI1/KNR4 family protein n=1 Tax=Streptomyces sp. NBC_00690 TaxID=2975808 RepID=UPI002E2CCE69|nr:SMI1/KNR4 family protein [Streptomyces sp. NBC_00690]